MVIILYLAIDKFQKKVPIQLGRIGVNIITLKKVADVLNIDVAEQYVGRVLYWSGGRLELASFRELLSGLQITGQPTLVPC